MDKNINILFSDHTVSYDRFIHDVARQVVEELKLTQRQPEFISQRQAFRIFGRANVERWRHTGLIQPIKRPGKLEYRYGELRNRYETLQDYEGNTDKTCTQI